MSSVANEVEDFADEPENGVTPLGDPSVAAPDDTPDESPDVTAESESGQRPGVVAATSANKSAASKTAASRSAESKAIPAADVEKPASRADRRAEKRAQEQARKDAEEAEKAAAEATRLADIAAREEAARILAEADKIEAARPIARLRRTAKRAMKLVALGVLALIALGAFVVWPKIDERYIQPIDANEANVAELQGQMTLEQQRIADLEGQVAEFDSLNGTRIGDIQSALAQLRTDSDALSQDLAAMATNIDEISTRIDDQDTRIANLDELAATLGTSLDETNVAASRQLGFLKATELLSRARLFLFQANYGLAEADVAAARTALVRLPERPGDTGRIDSVVERLDVVLESLPDLPVAAAADLDVAWLLLMTEPS